jgi:hypothetical protein
MNAWSKRLIFAVAVITVGWLTAVAFATSATAPTTAPYSSSAVAAHTNPAVIAHQNLGEPVGAAIPLSLAPAFRQAGTEAREAASGKLMSDQVFKNVQLLKGIPVDEFMGTMGVFTMSLSFCCGNCHVGAGTSNPKWEDDSNPRKVRARQMIAMVQGINKNNFQGRQAVTCWTCHHGNATPAVTAPLDFAYGEAVITPPDMLPRATSGGPTLDQVFNNYIQALGGQAKLDTITSYVVKGKSLQFGEVGAGNPSEIYAKSNGEAATFIHEQEGDVVRAYNGKTAWWQIPLTVTPQYELTDTLADGARFDAAMAMPWKIRSFFTNWRVSYPQSVSGADVYVIQGNLPDGFIGTLYFDQKTGLLKRYIRYATTMVGRIATQVDYDDYRAVNGIMMPFSYHYAWVSERDDWTMDSYEFNTPIDEAKFGQPDIKTAGNPSERKPTH